MKHTAFLAAALLTTAVAFGATFVRADAPTPSNIVVVDPNDLRQPTPPPQEGLMQKYDTQTVLFTGVVTNAGVEKKTNKQHYELTYTIEHRKNVKGKGTVVVGKETITVPVVLKGVDKNFHDKITKALRAKEAVTVTVVGTGNIDTLGNLAISEATVQPTKNALAPAK